MVIEYEYKAGMPTSPEIKIIFSTNFDRAFYWCTKMNNTSKYNDNYYIYQTEYRKAFYNMPASERGDLPIPYHPLDNVKSSVV